MLESLSRVSLMAHHGQSVSRTTRKMAFHPVWEGLEPLRLFSSVGSDDGQELEASRNDDAEVVAELSIPASRSADHLADGGSAVPVDDNKSSESTIDAKSAEPAEPDDSGAGTPKSQTGSTSTSTSTGTDIVTSPAAHEDAPAAQATRGESETSETGNSAQAISPGLNGSGASPSQTPAAEIADSPVKVVTTEIASPRSANDNANSGDGEFSQVVANVSIDAGRASMALLALKDKAAATDLDVLRSQALTQFVSIGMTVAGPIQFIAGQIVQPSLPTVADTGALVLSMPHFFARIDAAGIFHDGLSDFTNECATLTQSFGKQPLTSRSTAWLVTAAVIAIDVSAAAVLLRKRIRAAMFSEAAILAT